MGNIISSLNKITDTGWVALNPSHKSFANFSENQPYEIRRIDNMVQMRGALTPIEDIITEYDYGIELFTLDPLFRPSRRFYSSVNQGSGANRFQLIILAEGNVRIGRYGNNSSKALEVFVGNKIPKGCLLRMDAIYLAD